LDTNANIIDRMLRRAAHDTDKEKGDKEALHFIHNIISFDTLF
jgi:hypothetical protein